MRERTREKRIDEAWRVGEGREVEIKEEEKMCSS